MWTAVLVLFRAILLACGGHQAVAPENVALCLAEAPTKHKILTWGNHD